VGKSKVYTINDDEFQDGKLTLSANDLKNISEIVYDAVEPSSVVAVGAESSKDLVISICKTNDDNSGQTIDKTITLTNYFTSNNHNAVSSAYKNLNKLSVGSLFENKITNMIDYEVEGLDKNYTAKKVTGTVFNDTIDASKINHSLTINGGLGNDIITGTDYIYTDTYIEKGIDHSTHFDWGGYIYAYDDAIRKYTGEKLAKNEFHFEGNGADYVYEINKENPKYVMTVINTGNDKIYGGEGDDTIIGGSGADKLTGGTGTNTYIFKPCDGLDTITLTKGEIANLIINTDKYENGTQDTNLSYTIKGKDLVIHYNYNSDTITLKNYASKDVVGKDGKVLINGENLYNLFSNPYAVDTSKKYTGTRFTDEITINYVGKKNKGATVNTGAGNDIVTSGNGNDTINLNGAGEKTVIIAQNAGNDIINMNTNGVTANLLIDYNSELDNSNAELEYSKTGNNLVISRYYTNDGEYELGGTTTIKNYFANKTNSILEVNGISMEHNNVYVEGNVKKSNKIDLSKYGDLSYVITGGNKADKIITGGGSDAISSGAGNDVVYAGGGNNYLTYTSGTDKYYAGDGDDHYDVTFGEDTKLVITDDGGTDELTLKCEGLQSSDLIALFNVDREGNIAFTSKVGKSEIETTSLDIISKDTDASTLQKILKGKANGVVEIKNYFGNISDTSPFGTGAIEDISIYQGESLNMSSYINAVAEKVASWLQSTSYQDAMTVFNSNNTDDIGSLLNIYADNNNAFQQQTNDTLTTQSA
jgi:Ca2+-binding RTX toxin-like protein